MFWHVCLVICLESPWNFIDVGSDEVPLCQKSPSLKPDPSHCFCLRSGLRDYLILLRCVPISDGSLFLPILSPPSLPGPAPGLSDISGHLGPPGFRGFPLSQGLNLLFRVIIVEYTRCNFDILLCSFSLMSVTQLADN